MPTVDRGGVRLWYADVGTGPAVLLHTGGCGDSDMWERAGYADALGGARLLSLDHRGHGRSGRPAGLEAHRLPEYVADVVGVLDDAGVERAALVGYSGGAFTAYAVAAGHPDRVTAVVGIGGVELPDEGSDDVAEQARQVRATGTRAAITAMAAAEDEPCPDWLLKNLCGTDTEMFALLLQGLHEGNSEWPWFRTITAPTLIIAGEHEDEQGETAAAAAALADGEHVLLPGFGHLQAFWHGEVTAPLVRDFLVRRGILDPAG